MFSIPPPPETAEPLTPDPAPDSVSDSGQDRRDRLVRRMERLGDVGMEVVEALGRRVVRLAEAESDAVVVSDIAATTLALDRMGRFVRRAVAQEDKLADGALAAELRAREERAAKAAARRERVAQRRNTVHLAMNEAIGDDTVRPKAETERLLDDLDDLLDLEPDETFADERPIGAILWRLCRQLKLPVDLAAWEDEEWAAEEIVARPPDSPYTAYRVIPRGPAAPDTPIWTQRPREELADGEARAPELSASG